MTAENERIDLTKPTSEAPATEHSIESQGEDSLFTGISIHRRTTYPRHKRKQVQTRKHHETQHEHTANTASHQKHKSRNERPRNRGSFLIYKHILILLAPPSIQLQLNLTLDKYIDQLITLCEMYTWDSVRTYHLDFHQTRIIYGINDPEAWKNPDQKLKQLILVGRPARDNDRVIGSSSASVDIYFIWNSEKKCPRDCKYQHICVNCRGSHTKGLCPTKIRTSTRPLSNESHSNYRPPYSISPSPFLTRYRTPSPLD